MPLFIITAVHHRLDNFEKQLEHYPGPVSAAVYVDGFGPENSAEVPYTRALNRLGDESQKHCRLVS